MATRILVDGVIGDAASACISVLDRGFLYGDSVYEVLRTYGGNPFALADHLGRLQQSARLLDIPLPVPIERLTREIHSTIAAAQNAESYIRVVITRGAGSIGLDPALAVNPSRVIIVTDLRPLEPSFYQNGVKVCLVRAGRTADGALPARAKSGNYLTNLMALRLARQHNAHEAIMLDTMGRVAEGSTSNVFAVLDGEICTPPIEIGLLEGITRRRVMALAQSLGLAVFERQLRAEHLKNAQEIFITSTLREVLPVVRVDDWIIGDGQPGPITRQLQAAFAKLARSDTT